MKRGTRFLAAAALLGGLGLLAAGCFNPFRPNIAPEGGIPDEPPEPSSAVGVVLLFEWCWDNRNYQVYRELFTEDFHFYFALGDTAGNAGRGPTTNRDEELDIARNLFIGGGDVEAPPANRITLDWLEPIRAVDDTRPGKMEPWHQEATTRFRLDIDTDGEDYTVTGSSRFFMVRGDSAKIPDDLDLGPDPNRWYLEEWHDETPVEFVTASPGGGVAAARPSDVRGLPNAVVTGVWRRADGSREWQRLSPAAARTMVELTLGDVHRIWSR